MPRRIHPLRQSRLDVELDLMPVDRVFQRWATSVGSGLPTERWSDTHTQVPPLPDDAAIAVDRHICRSPERVRRFIHAWYRSQDASAVIAKRFGLSREGVYLYWRSVLWQSRAAFLAIPCVAKLMAASDTETPSPARLSQPRGATIIPDPVAEVA